MDEVSYSRWSHSKWYTFWCWQETGETIDNAIFEICDVARFTAKELRDDREGCLIDVSGIEDCTLDEIRELGEYMDTFIGGVNDKYSDA